MKKLLSVLLTTILAVTAMTGCTGSGSEEASNRLEKILAEGKIVVSMSPDYAPYEFIDPNKSGQEQYVGADVMLANYVADYLGVELEIDAMTFDAALTAVQQGKADVVISGLAYKEDRAEAMMLTDFFNVAGYQGVMVLTEDLDKYKTAEDFDGVLIGAQTSSLQYENVETQLPNAIIEPVTTISDGIMMLRSGKVDALAMSGVSGDQYARNYDDIAMCEFFFNSDNDGNVAGVMNGETELLEKMNEIIAKVNEEGLYEIWLNDAKALSEELSIN